MGPGDPPRHQGPAAHRQPRGNDRKPRGAGGCRYHGATYQKEDRAGQPHVEDARLGRSEANSGGLTGTSIEALATCRRRTAMPAPSPRAGPSPFTHDVRGRHRGQQSLRDQPECGALVDEPVEKLADKDRAQEQIVGVIERIAAIHLREDEHNDRHAAEGRGDVVRQQKILPPRSRTVAVAVTTMITFDTSSAPSFSKTTAIFRDGIDPAGFRGAFDSVSGANCH